MLVFNRAVNERIVIEGGIVIKLVESHEGYATIGIDAPRQIAVDREEIYLRKQQQRMASDALRPTLGQE
jgi:carbon storage regulator